MKNNKGLKIFIIIAVVSVFLGGKEILSKKNNKSSNANVSSNSSFAKILSKNLNKNKISTLADTSSPYVAVIHITGVISEANRTYNQKWLLEQIEDAKNNQNNRGILLNINSPGGTVYESDEAYLALLDYKEETKRPVFAYFESLAASGGYYIACSADYIYANRNTLTGSIGVIAGQSVDATHLLEKLGIKMTTITAGKNKNMGNYNSILTDEQRSILQSIADEAYDQFTGIVADSRNMDISTVKELADGRIYTAKQAKSNGLIDDVCSFNSAKVNIQDYFWGYWNEEDDLEESNNSQEENNTESDSEEAGEDVNFVDYVYEYEEKWMSLLSNAATIANNPEACIYEILGSTSGKCLYLYQ